MKNTRPSAPAARRPLSTATSTPRGAPNPYFNELYTEYYHRRINSRNFINSSRLTGVYDLKLPFTHQKIVGSVLYNEEEPYDFRYSEFVDQASGNFKGTLRSDKMVGLYYNYAESILLSNRLGGAQLKPGELRGPGQGDGHEARLRWMFLGGRLESNWTYYVSKNLRNNVNPGIPNLVRQTELGPIFGDEINPSGNDKSYRGNFDRDLDGDVEQLWSPGYTLYTLMTGYRTKIMSRNVDFSLNIYNLTDKDYFRSFSLFSGAWGDRRSFRFATNIRL